MAKEKKLVVFVNEHGALHTADTELFEAHYKGRPGIRKLTDRQLAALNKAADAAASARRARAAALENGDVEAAREAAIAAQKAQADYDKLVQSLIDDE